MLRAPETPSPPHVTTNALLSVAEETELQETATRTLQLCPHCPKVCPGVAQSPAPPAPVPSAPSRPGETRSLPSGKEPRVPAREPVCFKCGGRFLTCQNRGPRARAEPDPGAGPPPITQRAPRKQTQVHPNKTHAPRQDTCTPRHTHPDNTRMCTPKTRAPQQ